MSKKKLTILHSNDIHGDFLPAEKDGDMFQGSVIDSEYRGLSTIDLINLLAPDVTGDGSFAPFSISANLRN